MRHRSQIWNRYIAKYPRIIPSLEIRKIGMSAKDVSDLIKGTKLHSRLSQQQHNVHEEEISSDDDSDDPDFNPVDIDSEFIESQDEDDTNVSDDESMIDPNIGIVSTTSVGQSCIKKILNALKTIENKHKWSNENVNSFLQKYLCTKKSISNINCTCNWYSV